MAKQTGGCLCGQVRYELEGDPIATAVCHCTNCQRQSGAAFSLNHLVAEAQLTIKGELATFDDTSETGSKVYRKFCPKCGSPIISTLEAMPGMAAIKVGTLDDTSTVTPSVQVWCDSKQNWVELSSDLPGVPKNMPAA